MNNRFYLLLANTLVASLTNSCVWYALTFWLYLETKSVVATSVMAGIYLGTVAFSGFFLGSLVDHYRKKTVMMGSSLCSLGFYLLALLLYSVTPSSVFSNPTSLSLWAFILLGLLGAIVGNVRSIAISTLVTLLIEEGQRDRANGLVGTANGVSFLVASLFSGLAIAFLGVFWMLVLAIALTGLVVVHLWTVSVPESEIVVAETDQSASTRRIDIWGTLKAIQQIPGLLALIFFNTLNNFLGGVFMSLMDAYGLSLVSVQVWGMLWGFLSLGFIVGGLVVSRKGLGAKPLKTLFVANIIMWAICVFFTIQASIILLSVGLFIYMCLIPVVEAAEQTIIQKLISPERQGRVFGFAQSVEQAASPITAFIIGPIAELVFIPFMTSGAGVELLGGWFGTGKDRGLALLFTVTGLIGLVITLLAMRSRSYGILSRKYQQFSTESAVAESP
ncbi:DHA3 family multidrug efflux protein-like MFS transporter [Larkinella arboricola]|uniref:DHA3 family multidrug efflux protein-like MFS transporter n=1 Tax=Larkinella arboricola TaxID=643671 RepID=A0A327WWU6_LARAB|nr:MFS transporter [Larkinella arboricola]RAJ97782.1 DHA3 family multidrug efflux protein-like MFS transporter [Larkinella arboricola]